MIDKGPPCKNILIDSQEKKHLCVTDLLVVPMASCVTLLKDNRPVIFLSVGITSG